jgi:hypothetical protein
MQDVMEGIAQYLNEIVDLGIEMMLLTRWWMQLQGLGLGPYLALLDLCN